MLGEEFSAQLSQQAGTTDLPGTLLYQRGGSVVLVGEGYN